jgi:signal peptide peptidase SppA
MTAASILDPLRSGLRRLSGKGAPVVNVLRLSGVIGRIGPARGIGLALDGLERTIERAFRGRRIEAVALAINSPGGAPVQCDLLARRIRAAADERKVPVIAFAEDVAASGGYWLACAADEIYAAPSSIVGSIGVISAGFGFHGMLERVGVERRVHTTGERKGMLDPFRPEAPADVERLKAIQTDIHAAFMDMVRARRAGRLRGDEAEIFSGAVWSGREALALGLVDGLGDLRSVMRARFGDNVRLRPVAVRRGLLQRRLGVGPPGVAETAADLLAALDEWALWKRFGL